MIRPFPPKDADDRLRFYWDFSAWVADCGALVSYVIAFDDDPDGACVLDGHAQGAGPYAGWVMAWIKAGTRDVTYYPRCRATFADGTIKDDTRSVIIVDQ